MPVHSVDQVTPAGPVIKNGSLMFDPWDSMYQPGPTALSIPRVAMSTLRDAVRAQAYECSSEVGGGVEVKVKVRFSNINRAYELYSRDGLLWWMRKSLLSACIGQRVTLGIGRLNWDKAEADPDRIHIIGKVHGVYDDSIGVVVERMDKAGGGEFIRFAKPNMQYFRLGKIQYIAAANPAAVH